MSSTQRRSRKRQPARWAWWVATCGGLGYLKPGPGTWTSLAAAAVWWAMVTVLARHVTATLGVTVLLIAISTAVGIPASTIVARQSGREDPGFVTIDEAAGQWLTLLPVPLGFWVLSKFFGYDMSYSVGPAAGAAVYATVCLVLFRIFDIWKPWPVRKLESLHGGAGIMLDDLGAGLYAILVQLLFAGAMLFVRAK